MTPGPGIKPGTHWWEASALATSPALLSHLTVGDLGYRSGALHLQKLTNSVACFVPRANRAYWENLEPASGRPFSAAISKFDGPA